MHIKEILMALLGAAGVVAVAAFVMVIESLPMLVLLIAAGLLWIVLVILIIVDIVKQRREPVLWMVDGNDWVAQDGSGRRMPMLRKTAKLFDQDENKEAV